MVNRLLALDPETVGALASLDGKVVRIAVSGTALEYTLRLENGMIERLRGREAEPELTISGSPATLLRLVVDGDSNAARADPTFAVEGDQSLFEQMCEIRKRTDLDFEELLSRGLGDVAAHQMGNLARGTGEWVRQVARSVLADVGEFLSEEARYVASASELATFSSEVEALRDELARLTERIERARRFAGERRA